MMSRSLNKLATISNSDTILEQDGFEDELQFQNTQKIDQMDQDVSSDNSVSDFC